MDYWDLIREIMKTKAGIELVKSGLESLSGKLWIRSGKLRLEIEYGYKAEKLNIGIKSGDSWIKQKLRKKDIFDFKLIKNIDDIGIRVFLYQFFCVSFNNLTHLEFYKISS